MNFETLLQSKRKEKGLTQKQLAEEVNESLGLEGKKALSQAMLSAWESGRQRPSPSKEDQLFTIAKIVDIELPLLEELWKDGKKAVGFPDRAYIDDVKEWADEVFRALDEAGDTNAPSIWFIAPQNLPLFSEVSESIRDLWRQNLAAGISYHIVWEVTEIRDEGIFEKLLQFLGDLNQNVGRSDHYGEVVNYLISFDEIEDLENSRYVYTSFAFDGAEEMSKYHFGNKACPINTEWHNFLKVDYDPVLKRVLGDLEELSVFYPSRIAFYQSPTRRRESEATILLTNTRDMLHETPKHCYRWLANEQVLEIQKRVSAFQQWLRHKDFRAQRKGRNVDSLQDSSP